MILSSLVPVLCQLLYMVQSAWGVKKTGQKEEYELILHR